MIIPKLVREYMISPAGGSWPADGVFIHRAPEGVDAICIFGSGTPNRSNGRDGLRNFREETIEVEICRQKILGSDDTALDFTREKIYQDICRAPVTDKIVKITRDRESDAPQEGPEKGRFYYSMWFVVTVLL